MKSSELSKYTHKTKGGMACFKVPGSVYIADKIGYALCYLENGNVTRVRTENLSKISP